MCEAAVSAVLHPRPIVRPFPVILTVVVTVHGHPTR